jgi:hypothetical protein
VGGEKKKDRIGSLEESTPRSSHQQDIRRRKAVRRRRKH